MIWEVFRKEEDEGSHTHCGNVHAPDVEMAKQFSVIQHGRRKPTKSLWVAPQEKVSGVSFDEETQATDDSGEEATWAVFQQPRKGGYHTHAGSVSATDSDSAQDKAWEQYAEDEPHSIWVVQEQYIGEVNNTQVAFGGTTDKSYRFAQTYNVDPAAEEVEASENEQIDAEKRRRGES
jgi:ring-1,2-phenylacetyl-CoA epoxidase subunit PaaB